MKTSTIITINKKPLNISFYGHSGSGKSALIGQLLRIVQPEEIAKVEQGLGSDETISFNTSNFSFKIIPALGYRDFIKCTLPKNHANIMILVISAPAEQFEREISKDGKIKEQILLAKSTSCEKLIICINKLVEKASISLKSNLKIFKKNFLITSKK